MVIPWFIHLDNRISPKKLKEKSVLGTPKFKILKKLFDFISVYLLELILNNLK